MLCNHNKFPRAVFFHTHTTESNHTNNYIINFLRLFFNYFLALNYLFLWAQSARKYTTEIHLKRLSYPHRNIFSILTSYLYVWLYVRAARSFHVFTIQISKLNWAERAEKKERNVKFVAMYSRQWRHWLECWERNIARAEKEVEMQKKMFLSREKSAHTVVRAGICHLLFFSLPSNVIHTKIVSVWGDDVGDRDDEFKNFFCIWDGDGKNNKILVGWERKLKKFKNYFNTKIKL